MRKLRKLGIGMIIGMLGLSSCSPKYYVSNTQNVPLLSEKGEVDLTVSGNTDKVEFQGSFAATDHLGIQANVAYSFLPIWIMETVDQENLLN